MLAPLSSKALVLLDVPGLIESKAFGFDQPRKIHRE
jgi:hypothetical protein